MATGGPDFWLLVAVVEACFPDEPDVCLPNTYSRYLDDCYRDVTPSKNMLLVTRLSIWWPASDLAQSLGQACSGSHVFTVKSYIAPLTFPEIHSEICSLNVL